MTKQEWRKARAEAYDRGGGMVMPRILVAFTLAAATLFLWAELARLLP